MKDSDMIYSHSYYKIKDLFVCNLKKLGTDLTGNQQDIKFIVCSYIIDIGYECLSRYTCIFVETIMHFEFEAFSSVKEIKFPFGDSKIIYNAESIDMDLFTSEEKESGYVTDLRLMQIYNTINFNGSRAKNKIDIKSSTQKFEEKLQRGTIPPSKKSEYGEPILNSNIKIKKS